MSEPRPGTGRGTSCLPGFGPTGGVLTDQGGVDGREDLRRCRWGGSAGPSGAVTVVSSPLLRPGQLVYVKLERADSPGVPVAEHLAKTHHDPAVPVPLLTLADDDRHLRPAPALPEQSDRRPRRRRLNTDLWAAAPSWERTAPADAITSVQDGDAEEADDGEDPEGAESAYTGSGVDVDLNDGGGHVTSRTDSDGAGPSANSARRVDSLAAAPSSAAARGTAPARGAPYAVVRRSIPDPATPETVLIVTPAGRTLTALLDDWAEPPRDTPAVVAALAHLRELTARVSEVVDVVRQVHDELATVLGDMRDRHIVVPERGRAFPIDLGSCRPFGTGQLFGTRGYQLPSTRTEGTIDASADINALGKVLHEAVTDITKSVQDTQEDDRVGRHPLIRRPDFERLVFAEASAALLRLAERCTTRRRRTTATELRDRLEQIGDLLADPDGSSAAALRRITADIGRGAGGAVHHTPYASDRSYGLERLLWLAQEAVLGPHENKGLRGTLSMLTSPPPRMRTYLGAVLWGPYVIAAWSAVLAFFVLLGAVSVHFSVDSEYRPVVPAWMARAVENRPDAVPLTFGLRERPTAAGRPTDRIWHLPSAGTLASSSVRLALADPALAALDSSEMIIPVHLQEVADGSVFGVVLESPEYSDGPILGGDPSLAGGPAGTDHPLIVSFSDRGRLPDGKVGQTVRVEVNGSPRPKRDVVYAPVPDWIGGVPRASATAGPMAPRPPGPHLTRSPAASTASSAATATPAQDDQQSLRWPEDTDFGPNQADVSCPQDTDPAGPAVAPEPNIEGVLPPHQRGRDYWGPNTTLRFPVSRTVLQVCETAVPLVDGGQYALHVRSTVGETYDVRTTPSSTLPGVAGKREFREKVTDITTTVDLAWRVDGRISKAPLATVRRSHHVAAEQAEQYAAVNALTYLVAEPAVACDRLLDASAVFFTPVLAPTDADDAVLQALQSFPDKPLDQFGAYKREVGDDFNTVYTPMQGPDVDVVDTRSSCQDSERTLTPNTVRLGLG